MFKKDKKEESAQSKTKIAKTKVDKKAITDLLIKLRREVSGIYFEDIDAALDMLK